MLKSPIQHYYIHPTSTAAHLAPHLINSYNRFPMYSGLIRGKRSEFVGNNIMEGISDPETFELSETVEKSSKSGIFTNKRLLMIKDGFLYYFSNVPAQYKGHEPNLMSTLKEFPKCSIEIRSIQTIKLQSAKSSTLIITFYDKDMIDREDIRKSLSSKNYSHPVKPNKEDQEQWKFIFATVMKCRLWYGALIKLKQYFVKSQDKFDKFAEYMANFDPQIRSSLPQRASAPNLIPSPNSSTNTNPTPSLPAQQSPNKNVNKLGVSPESKYKLEKESGIFQIQEQKEEYDEQITPKNNKIGKFDPKPVDPPQPKPIEPPPEKEEPKEGFKGEERHQKYQEHPTITITEPKPPEKDPENPNQLLPFEIQPQPQQIKQIISEDIIVNMPPSNASISSKELSIAEEIRREEALRVQEQAAQLAQQQQLIRKMSEEIESGRRAKLQLQERVREEQERVKQEQSRRQEEERLRLILQREKKEEEQYRRLQESVRSDSPNDKELPKEESVAAREESVHTQYQRELIEVMEGGKGRWGQRRSSFKTDLRQSAKSDLRNSFKSELSLNPLTNERDTLNFFRNTISYISQVKIDPHEVESYDYFWEIGQLYRSTDIKQRVSRQLQLAEFIRKASRKATDLIVEYIDCNRPKEDTRIDRNIFQIEIVCERGRVVRTEGSERLVYPNDNHQRLKRNFKILNQLNEQLLSLLKKKPQCPLRVPFACLVEYKGYSALAKIVPPLQDHSVHAQQLKFLGPNLPLYNLTLNDFECHSATYAIVQPTIYFKISKEDETCLLRLPDKNFDFVSANRRAGISLASNKLFQQAKEAQANGQERHSLACIITFCRELKKIMKANTPFTDEVSSQLQFFQDFLQNPSAFIEQAQSKSQITGLHLYYIQRLLGIKMKVKLADVVNHYTNNQQFVAIPVVRKFTLSSLDVSAFASNFERYLGEKKYQQAQKSLHYSKQLEEDYAQTLLREAHLHITRGQCQQAFERLQLALQMLSLHDPRRLAVLELQAQCLEAVGEVAQALSTLRMLLQEAEYFLGNSNKLVWVYFLIADLLSRQGLTSELIQVYRRILHESPNSRQQVLLDFASSLLWQDSDPHVILDFLQKQLPQATEQQHPKVQQLMGQLYLRSKNRPKALGYFSAAMGSLAEGRQSDKVYQVFRRGIECCGSLREKKAFHRQVVGRLGGWESENWRSINTHVCCLITEDYPESERDHLIIFLEYPQTISQLRLLEWAWLQGVLKKIARCDNLTEEEKAILGSSIDKNAFSDNLILLNSPNLL